MSEHEVHPLKLYEKINWRAKYHYYYEELFNTASDHS